MKQGYVIKLYHINTGEVKYAANWNNLTDDVRRANVFENEDGFYINHRLNQLHHLNNYTYEIVPVASELGTYLKTTEAGNRLNRTKLGKKVDKTMLIMLSPILIPIALIIMGTLEIKEWIEKL